MPKKYGYLFMPVFMLAFMITSCRFPYKIVRNLTETPTVSASDTPMVMFSTQSPTMSLHPIPTAAKTPIIVDAQPVKGTVLTWMDESFFIFIPGGEYGIGKDSYNAADFSPYHRVTLSSFWIQQSEVTNQQYAQCVSDGKCSPPMQETEIQYWYENSYDGNHPVVGVTWFQAREYCAYIQSRLPTEAEWEAAARGSDGRVYPWGGDKPNCNYANFKGCLEPSEPSVVRSYSFGASDLNVLDMSGNVFEWVGDWYAKDYYQSSTDIDPSGPLDGRKRVYRGGSYKSSSDEMASYLRFALEPEKQSSDLGFRCVLQGDPLKDAALQQVAQPCTIAGMNDPDQIHATATPFPCADAAVSAFCQLLSGKPSYGVEIHQSGCLNNDLYALSGNSQPLSCLTTKLSDGGNKYQCSFPGMGQGITVNVNYCNVLDIPSVDITCPIGYQLDQNSKQCELKNPKLPNPPCPRGYQELPFYGCLPVFETSGIGCPVGYYSVETAMGFVCMPLTPCQLSNSSETCANTVCAAGQRFDEFKNCCASGDTAKKACPSNLLYDANQNVCIEPALYSKKCQMAFVKIPYCPTLTPSPTPTPEPQQDCSIYKKPDTCEANGCHWKFDFFYCY